jgi:DMSO/TMAO reductase YedYZ molybdopterin-dependent catalytic subunit
MDDSIRTGDARVPPGQYVTEKWPVLTYGETPRIAPADWSFRISGLVAREVMLSWADFQALPRVKVTADFHCVTRFSTLDNGWEGVSTRELLARAELEPDAAFVLVHSYGGYTTNLPLEDLLSERALLADIQNGRPLPVEHGGPARLVVPHLYAWKSAKWANGFELFPDDHRGFWEENGYHTYGDPWREERFSSQETHRASDVRKRARELGLVPGGPAKAPAKP